MVAGVGSLRRLAVCGRMHGFVRRDGRCESVDLPGAEFTMVRGLDDRGDGVAAVSQGSRRSTRTRPLATARSVDANAEHPRADAREAMVRGSTRSLGEPQSGD